MIAMAANVLPEQAASLSAEYIIARVREAHRHRWLEGRRRPTISCPAESPALRLLAERRLRAVPEAAAHALAGWARGERPALLLFDVPTPRHILALAARGWRCVSLLDRPDGLAFALHDLCHLEKFVDARYYEGQVGFFHQLDRAVRHPRWAALEEGLDPRWCTDRDHVLGDMNGSPIFLYCALRAHLRQATERAKQAWPERFATLLELLELEGRPRELAIAVKSRQADPCAAHALAAHFTEIGQHIRTSE